MQSVARNVGALAVVAVLGSGAGCGGGLETAHAESKPIGWVPPNAVLKGTVTIDGSTTVLPVSNHVAQAFRREHSGVEVTVNSSGTGTGFKKFCAGQVDVAGASRPINRNEHEDCDAHKVEFVELPFAFDSVTVVVNANNRFVECLSVPELKKMWEPDAEGKIKRWSQIRSGFPDEPLTLFGPGGESGTFDYFTLAVVGKQGSSRTDYAKSEDDTVVVNSVAGDPNALGYFGYSYYAANRNRLKLVSIDNGSGCIAPSVQAVAEDRYQPLTRPLFIYANKASLMRPEVGQLAHFYIAPESARFSLELGYMPLPTVTLLAVARRLDLGMTGSVFGDQGSVVGVTVDTFKNEDKIKNALVQ